MGPVTTAAAVSLIVAGGMDIISSVLVYAGMDMFKKRKKKKRLSRVMGKRGEYEELYR